MTERLKRLVRRVRGGPVVDRVLVEFLAPPEEVAAIEEAFARSGFQVEVEAEYPLTGGPPTELVWALYVAVGGTLTSFFGALGAEAGKDAYAAVKDWVRRVRKARRDRPGGEIRIYAKDASMAFPAEISDEAIDALADVDWARMPGGHLIWDEGRQAWRDTRDLWDADRQAWRDNRDPVE